MMPATGTSRLLKEIEAKWRIVRDNSIAASYDAGWNDALSSVLALVAASASLKDFDLEGETKFPWRIIGAVAFRREWKQDGKCAVCHGWNEGETFEGHFNILGSLDVLPICGTCLDRFSALEGLRKKIEAIDEEKMLEDFYLAEGKRFGTPNGDERAIQTELVKFAIGYISGFIYAKPIEERRGSK
ncbi:MAG: hypothetical protein JRN62_02935 [Nitrososphaerota archaeon]|jgi:hypothetical protein|nr:hypothetical protein [Nitrososphaerota archaeon]MDG6948949.1 hypothetical protein [Nitrososphaerota archaeon]